MAEMNPYVWKSGRTTKPNWDADNLRNQLRVLQGTDTERMKEALIELSDFVQRGFLSKKKSGMQVFELQLPDVREEIAERISAILKDPQSTKQSKNAALDLAIYAIERGLPEVAESMITTVANLFDKDKGSLLGATAAAKIFGRILANESLGGKYTGRIRTIIESALAEKSYAADGGLARVLRI